MDKRYRIVFKGQLVPGFTLDEVCENLAVHFKTSSDAIRQKLAQVPAILKSDLDVHQANHYLEVLAGDGLMTQLEVMQNHQQTVERRLQQRRRSYDRRHSKRSSGMIAERRKGTDRRQPR